MAWLGDVWLSLNLRVTCLIEKGRRDQAWVASKSESKYLARYLKDVGYRKDIEKRKWSDHSAADAFEYLYATEKEFRETFNRKHNLENCDTPIDKVVIPKGLALEQCWKQLFKGDVMSSHPWRNDKWLTRKQLVELAKENELSDNRFGLLKNGYDWHLVDGSLTAREVLDQMVNKARLGAHTADVDHLERIDQMQTYGFCYLSAFQDEVVYRMKDHLGFKPYTGDFCRHLEVFHQSLYDGPLSLTADMCWEGGEIKPIRFHLERTEDGDDVEVVTPLQLKTLQRWPDALVCGPGAHYPDATDVAEVTMPTGKCYLLLWNDDEHERIFERLGLDPYLSDVQDMLRENTNWWDGPLTCSALMTAGPSGLCPWHLKIERVMVSLEPDSITARSFLRDWKNADVTVGGAKLIRPKSMIQLDPSPRVRHNRSLSEPAKERLGAALHPLDLIPLVEHLCNERGEVYTEEILFKVLSSCWTCSHGGVKATFSDFSLCHCSSGVTPLDEWLFGDPPVFDSCKNPSCKGACGCSVVEGGVDAYNARLHGTLCWKGLFPEWESFEGEEVAWMMFAQLQECITNNLMIYLEAAQEMGYDLSGYEQFDSGLLWDHLEISQHGEIWHVQNPSVGRTTPEQKNIIELCQYVTWQLEDHPEYEEQFVELTTAVVLGTIGDVEPTLDVVAANHFSALTQAESAEPWNGKFRFDEMGHGWCASDFLDACPSFARALDDKFGAAKGTLEVMTDLWNEICQVWGGERITLLEEPIIGGFPVSTEPVWEVVPNRPIGDHERKLPDDFVLLTHADHLDKLQASNPGMMAGVETRVINCNSHDFIKLGQEILEGGLFALSDMKKMQQQLLEAVKETLPIVEQSDLVYLVSGTTFHYFIGSLFPDKQVFEVCPVPREDNGTCPEFYLGHYAEYLGSDVRLGHTIGRLYSQWLTTPLYLRELEWEGEYKYTEPPKFHSIMPWAQEKWKIESPNIGFKPYGDIVKKTTFVETPRIKAYFSLGSCATLPQSVYDSILWLRALDVEWHVDPRWKDIFDGLDPIEPGFFTHSTGLAEYDWVIHHGGSGVTNTCLAVGVPQTILPVIGDQFIWHKALKDHCIPTFVDEEIVRAHLYHVRLPRPIMEEFANVSPSQSVILRRNGAVPVKPYWEALHCCHDTNEYGLKDLNLIIGESDSFLFSIYDQGMQRNGTPGKDVVLKWRTKICQIENPPIEGWRGINVSATYPWHAHGWLGPEVPREGLDSMLEVPREWLLWLANQSRTAKDKRLTHRSTRTPMGDCKRCGRHREVTFLHCSRCVGDIVATCAVTGEIPDLPPVLDWSGSKRKGPDKSKAVGLQLSGRAIRSNRRYFQLDTRSLDKAPNRQVARALLDHIKSWSDIKWVEAFWDYTQSRPPHYTFTTDTKATIDEMAKLYVAVEVAGIAQDVVNALGKVLSISSPTSLARRLVGLNILTPIGRGIQAKKWHVMVDALRHFSDFAATLDVQAMPKIIENRFAKLPEAEARVYVHYKGLIASPLRSRRASSEWITTLAENGSTLRIHLFSLKIPALGQRFGVFHAVVEYAGKFYELQQVAGNYTHINVSHWQPEATPDRPLVKTICIDGATGMIPERLIAREFSGNDYKVLGDNCLVFANFLVYHLTGKVVPWRHFGAFGEEVSLEFGALARKWATSFFWTDEQEVRVCLPALKLKYSRFDNNAAQNASWTGPRRKVKDYGLHALRTVDAIIERYEAEGNVDSPWHKDSLVELALLGYKEFGLSSHLLSQALFKLRTSKIPTRKRKWNLLLGLAQVVRKLPSTRLVGDMVDLATLTSQIRMPMRKGRKPAWAPLLNITVPRHWFRDRDRLVEVKHDPEDLTVGNKKIVKLDLPQIVARYKNYFPGVKFPRIGFKFVKPGEYEIGVKVPLRKNLPRMDDLTWKLVTELQEMHPFELGIFSLRFGTEAMAEKVTDRYFAGTFDTGQLIPEEEQQALADAIFENNPGRFANAQLINPEEVYRKWHKNYSAGFPFRFNSRGNAKRQALIDAVGGKKAFLEGVRRYIASPESFPTVSHAFIKDEVLPKSYVERQKIRTIIAQDPLNYFAEMAISADTGHRVDPLSFSAVGVSPAHGEMAALAERHLAFKHHFAMDVTSLDSTAAVDAASTIKKLRYRSFENHPQFENIKTMIDACMDNLVSSWIVDIHTGRARLKHQGFTTGHAATTSDNTYYMEIMMLKAYHGITGRPYKQFYEDVKFSSFSDDNFWSTNLPPNVFSADLISEYWLTRGVQVRVEGASDDLSDLSFLAKRFSFDEKHLSEIRALTGRDAKVAIVHDIGRLLQKFSDYKKKNHLAYRWEKLIALQSNCAHYPDVYNKVSEYLDAIEKEMRKRKFLRTFMKQHPRKSYNDIMILMYSPGKKPKENLLVTTMDNHWSHEVLLWWDAVRVDIMAFDSTASAYARVLQGFTGLLEIGGLNPEDPGVFLRQPGDLPEDPEYTLEHHCWLLNGCPSSFETFRMLAQKTPFSAFMRLEAFWARRDRFSIEECVANGLRAKVITLQLVYVVVAWLERALGQVPGIGSLYRLFCSAKGMSRQVYSRLNSLYYAMFGDSSLVLSAMMPKDDYIQLKILAFKVWTHLVSTDVFDFDGDLDQFQAVADSAAKLTQDLHNLFFELDFSALIPKPDTGEGANTGRETGWEALDHGDSVLACIDALEENKYPMVNGPTGCGKSTDFIVSLHKEFRTVLVSVPRRVLVKNSPVAQKRLYSGSSDKLTPGLINFGTSGYFRQVLGEMPDDCILVLDEFHELDEDTLALRDQYPERCVVITATPNFPNSSLFAPITLTKSRISQFSVSTVHKRTKADIEAVWSELTGGRKKSPFEKVLCILPSVKMVKDLSRHALKMVSDKRVCELYRGNDQVWDADWYFATSIVDAGLTIPGLTLVIDTGWSMGWEKGKFVRRQSSHNVSDQRRGRTGRTCNGEYVRLQTGFNDEPWDFSVPFIFNHRQTAKRWNPHFKKPAARFPGCLQSLPFGYDDLLEGQHWSHIIYLAFYYENRGDLNRTRAAYQSARKFPDAAEVQFLMGPNQNRNFLDLHVVENALAQFRIPGFEGNVWRWDGAETVLQQFLEPIPSHLQDPFD